MCFYVHAGYAVVSAVESSRVPLTTFLKAFARLRLVDLIRGLLNPRALFSFLTIPEIKLTDLVGNSAPTASVQVPQYADGALPPEQALTIAAIAIAIEPRIVLEIGTFTGYTTNLLAENLPEAVIHTVDLPRDYCAASDTNVLRKDDWHLIESREVGLTFGGRETGRRIIQHFSDTASWDFRNAAGANFFFIDGSHTYDYCRSDSEQCFELCGGKGFFVWHDCDIQHAGVVRLLSEWRKSGREIVRVLGTSLALWNSLAPKA